MSLANFNPNPNLTLILIKRKFGTPAILNFGYTYKRIGIGEIRGHRGSTVVTMTSKVNEKTENLTLCISLKPLKY